MTVLGIDPSLTNTGCVKITQHKDAEQLWQQSIKSKPTGKSYTDELKRIINIKNEINLDKVKFVALEGLAFSARNTRASAQLAALNYLIRERLFKEQIPFVIVPPTTLKKFVTDRGNSPKEIMMLATYKKYGVEFKDNNLCDAFCLAKLALALKSKNIKLTQPQRSVIKLLKSQIL